MNVPAKYRKCTVIYTVELQKSQSFSWFGHFSVTFGPTKPDAQAMRPV